MLTRSRDFIILGKYDIRVILISRFNTKIFLVPTLGHN